MRYRIWPYRQGSVGAKALAVALGGRVLRREGSVFSPNAEDRIINWGDINPPETFSLTKTFNFGDVQSASNKLKFFNKMKELGHGGIIPKFWSNRNDIPDDAYPVVCRASLAGHSGHGISIADSSAGLVDCQLYVKYVKKKDEYRVHVGIRGDDDIVIAVQRKARRLETPDEDVNWKVRNLVGGFIYARGGFTTPSPVLEVARRCLRASGLDFGAVDVLWNAEKEKAYVLEINTAPGLCGQTIEDYAAFFKGEV